MASLLGEIPGEDAVKEDARRLATLPMRLGGLGLRSASRMAPGAFWASWADALAMLHKPLPVVTEGAVSALEGRDALQGCLGKLQWASLVNGHTVGNTTRLPLPSTTFGSP